MSNRGRRCLTALAVAATLTAACNGDDDTNGSPVITDPVETTSSTSSSSSTSPTTADPQAAVKAEVEAAYLAYDSAYLEIFGEPNPENPLIDRYMTGPVRDATLDTISEHIVNGRSVRAPADPEDLQTTVLDVTVPEGGTAAQLRACLVDGTVLIDNSTGNVLNDKVATLLVDVTLLKLDGAWKVSESTVAERRDGRWNCADE